MGYTHYWTQRRNFTAEEWAQTTEDLQSLLKAAEHEQGIPLADGSGDAGTRPLFGADEIVFNGLGDDAHETFIVYRKRQPKEAWQSRAGTDFCKTARKPYDLAVTACLAYLSTVLENAYHVSTDGDGAAFLAGVELAREALPRWGNVLDIPMGIMEDDRWCGPWVHNKATLYEMHFCVDGRAYVIRRKDGLAYTFETHHAAAEWAKPHNAELLNPMGSFNQARWERIKRGQTKLFRDLFRYGELFQPERFSRPPAFVRPNQFAHLSHSAYSIDDVLSLARA